MFGPGQAEVLTQDFQQSFVRRKCYFRRLAIQRELYVRLLLVLIRQNLAGMILAKGVRKRRV